MRVTAAVQPVCQQQRRTPSARRNPVVAGWHRVAVVLCLAAPLLHGCRGQGPLCAGISETQHARLASGWCQYALVHAGPVRTAVFSQDGRWIVSGGEDATLRVWDRTDGREVARLPGHEGAVTALAAGKDERVVSGGADGSLRVWGLPSGRALRVLRGHGGEVSAVRWLSGSRILSAGRDGSLSVWDGETGNVLASWAEGDAPILALATSSDGRLAATASPSGIISVWDATSGERLRTLEGHGGGVPALVFLPDGTLASGGSDRTLRLWDVENGKARSVLRASVQPRPVTALAASADGRWLFAGNDVNGALLWDVEAGAPADRLQLFQGVEVWNQSVVPIHAVDLAPDGGHLLLASDDGRIRIFDLAAKREERPGLGHAEAVTGVAISPDGSRVASASLDRSIRLWDLASGALRATLSEAELEPSRLGGLTSVAFSPDGARILAGSRDRSAKSWARETGEPGLQFQWHERRVNSVAFSPNGDLVASGSYDGALKLWDAATGRELRSVPAHEGEVFSLDFSPDGGRLVSGGYDHAIRLWEVSTGSLLREIDGHRGWVSSVAFSKDGSRVLSASEDGTVGLWEAESGARLERLVGHGAVSVARPLASGRYVIYAGSDRTIHIFDTREHEEMDGIDLSRAGDTASSLAICPDETCFVVGTQAGAVLKFELDL